MEEKIMETYYLVNVTQVVTILAMTGVFCVSAIGAIWYLLIK